jgi:uncharacterized protein YrrD
MLRTMTDILSHKARSGDTQFPVTEVFFDLSTGKVGYVALDVGHWFDTTEVLVPISQMTKPTDPTGEWVVKMDRAAVEAAPKWSDQSEDTPTLASEAGPSMMLGPFGNAMSPLLIFGPLRDMVDGSVEPSDPIAEAKVAAFQRATFWIGAEVAGQDDTGRDEVLGSVDDLLLDASTLRLTHVVIDNGKVLAGRQLAVPYEKVLTMSDMPHQLRMQLTASTLEKGPQIETMDGVDRHWLDTLRTYYQLPL